jgi:hypothetical protein
MELTADEGVNDSGAGRFPGAWEELGSNQYAIVNPKMAALPPNSHRRCSGEHGLRWRTSVEVNPELQMPL